MLDRVSIELTNRCAKACSFCYNASGPAGETAWQLAELEAFVRDLAANGVKAVSFGGGEPLQYSDLFALLDRTKELLFRSLTTNGLLLEKNLDALVAASPDKVHVSIHSPRDAVEVARVVEQVHVLAGRGVKSGVNFLVRRSELEAAVAAAKRVRDSGVGNERIVYLPMRGQDTPTPDEVGRVAGSLRFQSMTCLPGCAKSERFCSVGWDKKVAWCSYTTARRPLRALTHRALLEALEGLELVFCGP